MEESSGAQYALQVALQTLKDRCLQFQQRIADLEDENINLRSKCNASTCLDTSLPEVNSLHQQISQLTEQKLQLSKKVEMVTAENNNLWARLSQLTQVKENLDSKLTKINDTISSRTGHTNLVRSKTFKQNEPHIVFAQGNIQDESAKLSLELEDISLRLLSSIAKEKQELEMQCSEMIEMQTNDILFGTSYAFASSGDEVIECDQLEKQLTALRIIHVALLKQKEMLGIVESAIALKSNNTCANCKVQKSTVSKYVQTSKINKRPPSLTGEESAQLQSLLQWGTPDNSFSNNNEAHTTETKDVFNTENIKICPMCSRIFYNNTAFAVFQQHVENHFMSDIDTDYEIVA